MKQLAHFYDLNRAHALVSMLEANNIACDIRNEHTGTMYWLYTNAIGGYQVMVNPDCLSEAIDILGLYNTNAPYQKCPKCNSSKIRYIRFGVINAIGIFIGGFCLPARKYKMQCDECKIVFERSELVEEYDEQLNELEKLAQESKMQDVKPKELPIYFAFLKGYIIVLLLLILTAPLRYSETHLRSVITEDHEANIEYYLQGSLPYLYGPIIGGIIGVLLRRVDESRKKRLDQSGRRGL